MGEETIDEVMSADDAVADAELAFAELESLAAQAADADESRSCCVVEFANVVAPVGEHDGAGWAVLGDLPPVFEQALFAAVMSSAISVEVRRLRRQ